MGTYELWTRQVILKRFHVHQRHYFLAVFEINSHIVFQTLNIQNVVEANLYQFVVALYKHEPILLVVVNLSNAVEPVECFLCHFDKTLVAYGFQQIAQGVILIAFESIFAEGGGEDDSCFLRQQFGKFQSAEFRHLYVEE